MTHPDRMNAEPIFAPPAPAPMDEPDHEVAEALVLLYRLPHEAIESINASMRSLHLGFSEAALHTGLVSQSELDEAHRWVQTQNLRDGRGIVEETLRRKSARKAIVVYEGERLSPGKDLVVAHDPDSQRSETIRSLRTELLMRTSGRRGAGMFALVSPNAGEGRSQLCAELAIAFAQLGSRTLLVDADLRNPKQHVLFGAPNEFGLAQALVDSRTLRVHAVAGAPQMELLTSGALPPNALELLSSTRFERLMGDWRQAYEYVVIDTPPAAKYSDSFPIATAAGNVVLLGRTNMTSFHSMTEIQRKLMNTHARVVGAVMSAF